MKDYVTYYIAEGVSQEKNNSLCDVNLRIYSMQEINIIYVYTYGNVEYLSRGENLGQKFFKIICTFAVIRFAAFKFLWFLFLHFLHFLSVQ